MRRKLPDAATAHSGVASYTACVDTYNLTVKPSVEEL